MKQNLSVVLIALLLSQQAPAAANPSSEARAAFRAAVEGYQDFVVPRCAPDEVRAYVIARANRDHTFVSSLRNTKLLSDYKRAVRDRAHKDESTVYECFGPPPPPPPPPLPGSASAPAASVRQEARPNNTLAEHFEAGDKQFETMARLRNAALGPRRN